MDYRERPPYSTAKREFKIALERHTKALTKAAETAKALGEASAKLHNLGINISQEFERNGMDYYRSQHLYRADASIRYMLADG